MKSSPEGVELGGGSELKSLKLSIDKEVLIEIVETWQPSVQLRFVKRKPTSIKKTLQQLHTSNLGNREWKDVPTVIGVDNSVKD